MKWPIKWIRTKDRSAPDTQPAGHDNHADAPRTETQSRGQQAEQLVMQFLHRHGVATVARNIRCRRGEIDLVCLDGDILVFVEVRLRSDNRFGGAAESITPEKRQRIISAARWWLKGLGHTHANRVCRFDALLLSQLDESRITWVRDAFTTDDE